MRVIMPQGAQRVFLDKARAKCGRPTLEELSKVIRVSHASLKSWYGERWSMPAEVVDRCCALFGVSIPANSSRVPDNWGSVLGGKRRIEIGGNPGTPEGRRKGGAKSSGAGSNIKIMIPGGDPPYSAHLAELVGIILGDGHICFKQYRTDTGLFRACSYAVSITVSRSDDWEFANHVAQLIKAVLRIEPRVYVKEDENRINIKVYGRQVVEYLGRIGMIHGDKMKNGIHIPRWVQERAEYISSCIRGFFDTDGSIYRHQNGAQMSFCNRNMMLFNDLRNGLVSLGFNPSRITGAQFFLCRQEDIIRYSRVVGFHNPKHSRRFEKFCLKA